MSHAKTFRSRFIHALGFELIGLLICVPLLSFAFDVSVTHAGVLTVMISLLAMTWNMIFNFMFDRALRRFRLWRGLLIRVIHATLFETGLLLIAVPLAAWWLEVGLIDALVLDLGLLLFFLPYTLIYNWAYDRLFEPRPIESVL
jgi:uncharacterized membrane protein